MEQLWQYDGPVMMFDRCIQNRWLSSTYAPTESKAKSNLAYQYKKNNNKTSDSKITLPGKLVKVI